jgi:hypothetical protein
LRHLARQRNGNSSAGAHKNWVLTGNTSLVEYQTNRNRQVLQYPSDCTSGEILFLPKQEPHSTRPLPAKPPKTATGQPVTNENRDHRPGLGGYPPEWQIETWEETRVWDTLSERWANALESAPLLAATERVY